jgi:hypothetical protein
VNEIKAFGSIERAVRDLLLTHYEPLTLLEPGDADQLVGGDFAFEPDMPFYIRIDKVDSQTDRFQGDFILDIEVFAAQYLDAESRSLDIEALLLGYPHVVEAGDQTWVFDSVSQNSGPDELPWEDDETTRLGATYVITARRR